jgi:hypothetical protein
MYMCALMMEAVITSETFVNFYQTTRPDIPEDSDLQMQVCDSSLPDNITQGSIRSSWYPNLEMGGGYLSQSQW